MIFLSKEVDFYHHRISVYIGVLLAMYYLPVVEKERQEFVRKWAPGLCCA